MPNEAFSTSFSDPGKARTIASEEKHNDDFTYLLDACLRYHRSLKRFWARYQKRSGEERNLKFAQWYERHGGEMNIDPDKVKRRIQGGRPLITRIEAYKTMRRGFHVYRTYHAQQTIETDENQRYNCGVIGEFEIERRLVPFYGEALDFVRVEIDGKWLYLVRVRWFETSRIVSHRLLPGVPIVQTPVEYISPRKKAMYGPYVEVGTIKGSFFTGDITIPLPCDHVNCREKINKSKISQCLVPCKSEFKDPVLFPWKGWTLTPKEHRVRPESDCLHYQSTCDGMALLRHSHIQTTLKYDKLDVE